MKNILISVCLLIVLIIMICLAIYPPQKISFGSGFMAAPEQFTVECVGIYFQTWDYTPIDGARGGFCFGKIKETENKKLQCVFPFTPKDSWCY